jgi:hypothetical protein
MKPKWFRIDFTLLTGWLAKQKAAFLMVGHFRIARVYDSPQKRGK